MSFPRFLYGRIFPLDNFTASDNIDIDGGTIDPDHQSEVKVTIVNSSQKYFPINASDAIAQIIFQHAATPTIHLRSTIYPPTPTLGGTNKATARPVSSPSLSPDIIPHNDEETDPPDQIPNNSPHTPTKSSIPSSQPVPRPIILHDKARSGYPVTKTIIL